MLLCTVCNTIRTECDSGDPNLGALMIRRLPIFPGSIEPYLSALLRAAAALIVAPTNTSSKVMCMRIQDRCITIGCEDGEEEHIHVCIRYHTHVNKHTPL